MSSGSVLGIDVGRRHDRTAIVSMAENTVENCTLITGTPIPAQVRVIAQVIRQQGIPLAFVDITGLGVGLYDGLREQDLPVIGVSLSGGEGISYNGEIVVASKYVLAERLRLAVAGGLTVAPDCANRDILQAELRNFVGKFNRNGRMSFEAATGHDDLVIALCLAILARNIYDASQRVRSRDGTEAV